MAEESMFGIGNIFDAATVDNVGIRDRALKVAQLQPGRASVYGATQAGGMLMQNLAGMAGMKTAQQEKAETITNILKGAQNMDQNNPNTLRNIANEFIQAGLPGIGQKFLDKARTMQTQDRTFDLETRKTDLLERQVVSEEAKTKSDIGVQESRLELDFGKFENLKYQQDRDYDLATSEQERLLAKDEYAKTQDAILNEIRNGDLDIARARQMLAENEFEFTKMFEQQKVDIQKDQWQQSYNLEELNSKAERELKLAQKDNIIIETENYTYNNDIRNAKIEADTEAQLMATKLAKRGLEMPPDGMFLVTNDGDRDIISKYNVETGEYDTITDPKEIEAAEYGLTAAQARVYDRIWDQYKLRFFVSGAFPGEGNWKEGTPEFLSWAESNVTGEEGLDIIRIGQGGTRKTYNNKLEENFNNERIPDNSAVAVTVESKDEITGELREDVVVADVETDFLSDKYNINKKQFDIVPAKLNGKNNKLSNGQILTSLLRQGKAGEAEEFAATLAGEFKENLKKVENTGREKQIDDTSETNWTKVKISDSRYQTQSQQARAEAKGEIKKMGGVWYTNK